MDGIRVPRKRGEDTILASGNREGFTHVQAARWTEYTEQTLYI